MATCESLNLNSTYINVAIFFTNFSKQIINKIYKMNLNVISLCSV